MTEKSFTGTTVLCPSCKRRTFYQDQPWKVQCVSCYLARKGRNVTTARTTSAAPIEPAMLRRLIQLAHPDRHGNSEAATVATRYLLALKGQTP